MSEKCTICLSPAAPIGQTVILQRHEVTFYQCQKCGFIRTESPHWLEEAYSAAITGSDVGLVQRNCDMAAISKVVISVFFNSSGKFVDYAGGYGLFVRLMRDSGYDFYWYDKYCANMFAQGFQINTHRDKEVELVTAFELFEHLANPVEELEQMLAYSRNILFTTQLLPEPAPLPGQWWYYGEEHGQHIAFYTRQSLAYLAKKYSLNFYTNGSSMHLFTEKKLSQSMFFSIARFKTARFLAPLFRRPSLLMHDYKKTTGSDLEGGTA